MFNQKEYMKQWRKDNKAYCREYNKKWRENNPEYMKQYRQEHKKHRTEYNKQWKEKHEEYYKKRDKYYHQEHKEYHNKLGKKWREENPEYNNEYQREWLKTEKGKANSQRGHFKRRTREKGIINTLTSEEWLDILKEYDYKCAYCECEFDENTLPTRDHIIPISKGGNNIKENVVPTCRSCNSKKGNKILY